ncbi:hypothetical protein ABZW18_00095 [Streptomyces sp. NPDC004647]|uniref:hypothetical protein n=1 Tax=Streptomyces sp. NPDC004647 TaxID=3154671 RepID=UPI0033BCBD44
MKPGWPEGALTQQPPLCLEHAVVATQQCGPLVDRGHIALRVRRPRLYGVIGVLYQFGSQGVEAVPGGQVTLHYGDRRAPWLLASQLLRRLCDVTIVDLDAEVAAAEATPPAAAQ